jgi:hypothetical protein
MADRKDAQRRWRSSTYTQDDVSIAVVYEEVDEGRVYPVTAYPVEEWTWPKSVIAAFPAVAN